MYRRGQPSAPFCVIGHNEMKNNERDQVKSYIALSQGRRTRREPKKIVTRRAINAPEIFCATTLVARDTKRTCRKFAD